MAGLDYTIEYLDKRMSYDPIAWKNLSDRIVFSERPVAQVPKKDKASRARTLAEYQSICSGSVRPKYIYDQLNNDDQDFMIGVTDTKTNKLSGFIVGNQEDSDNEMQIDVICAKPGQGQVLMNRLFQVADAAGKNVGLSALPTVLTQYLRYGFTFRKSCSDTPQVPTDEQIQLIRKANVHKVKDTYNSPEIQQVLLELHARDLNVKKVDGCDKAKVLRDIVDESCADDGQSMKRCAMPTSLRRTSPKMTATRVIAPSVRPPSPVAPVTQAPLVPPSRYRSRTVKTEEDLDRQIAKMVALSNEPRRLRSQIKRKSRSRSRSPPKNKTRTRRF